MAQIQQIEHEGVVEKAQGGRVWVRILSQSACASCHAKSACTAADQQEKMIEVTSNQDFVSGEKVVLVGEKKLGLQAAWWAYILPLILVVVTLIISFAITANETLSGVLSLCILIPYFTSLKLLHDKFTKTFSFSIKPSTSKAL
jgi:sigma-E factor negative regulatory protein RseC